MNFKEITVGLDMYGCPNRCRAFGGEFSFFLHQGSCDGESEKLYGVWVTPDDLAKIPPLLEAYTLRRETRQAGTCLAEMITLGFC